jgi:hypothetical protein
MSLSFLLDPVFIAAFAVLGLILSPALILFSIYYFFFIYKKIFYFFMSPKLVQLYVRISGADETAFKNCEKLFSGIHGMRQNIFEQIFFIQNRFSFEILSRKDGIFFYVVVPKKYAANMEKQIYGIYENAEIEYQPLSHPFDRGTYNLAYELKQTGSKFLPIKLFEEKQEPLNTVLSTMSKMEPQDSMMIQIVISPAPVTWIWAARRILSSGDNKENYTPPPGFKEGLEKKISSPLFYSQIRLLSVSDNLVRAQINLDNLLSTFNQYNDPKGNSFNKKILVTNSGIIRNLLMRYINTFDFYIPLLDVKLFCNNLILNCEEMANLYHFGNKNIQVPGVKNIDYKKSPPPGQISDSGIILGVNKFRDVKTLIRISDEDRLRHTYILGQTGTGKSVFLFSQALQDIVRGKGVCILDPHGKDANDLLMKIPKHREKDVIYFKASDVERPFGINVLEAENEHQRNNVVNYFIELLKKLYDPHNQGFAGPQFEQAVRSSMMTCIVDPEATLVDVVEVIRDPEKAEKYLDKVKDPDVISYWRNQIANTTAQVRAEQLGYFISKFTKFTSDTFMRNIIAQPKSSINIPKIMDEQKILIINLDKGNPNIGEENAKFLGLLLVPKITYSALARTTKIEKGESFEPFYFYVDEFQNFATDSFNTILSEARKFKLSLTVANQYISQLNDEIKGAVFGNVGTTVFFRVGAEDATFCTKVFGGEEQSPFKEGDFAYLDKGNCYVKLLVNGQPTKPFYMNIDMKMMMPFEDDPQTAKRIIENSRNQYGRSVDGITDFIQKRFNEFYKK